MRRRLAGAVWLSSRDLDRVSCGAECFFWRLLMASDEEGCCPGSEAELRSLLYPDGVSAKAADMEAMLAECVAAGLVQTTTADGRRRLYIRGRLSQDDVSAVAEGGIATAAAQLAQEWLFYHRGPKTRATDLRGVCEVMDDLLRLGIDAGTIGASIRDRQRDRTMPIWEFSTYVRRRSGVRSSSSKRQSERDMLEELREFCDRGGDESEHG